MSNKLHYISLRSVYVQSKYFKQGKDYTEYRKKKHLDQLFHCLQFIFLNVLKLNILVSILLVLYSIHEIIAICAVILLFLVQV